MISIMEQASLGSRRRDEPDFGLREWSLRARISRENTNSRRFSASNIRSFREEARSFRSNATISSTASSPGYTLRDEIDPSTYSFTTALKALQVRSSYSWECLSPDGFALNSKWYEAEKYISNPLSGEVPMECLSAKTLSGISIPPSTASRASMSGPLVCYSHARHIQKKPTIVEDDQNESAIQEKKVQYSTRDVGTQSTPPDLSSSSPSPTSTPSIKERSLRRCEVESGESPNNCGTKVKPEEEIGAEEKVEKQGGTREDEEEIRTEKKMCKCRQGGCLSWTSLWMGNRQRGKHKLRWQVSFGKRNICKK
ncbi:PREDICTED: uncharacterized protein LOC104601394 [Nelumbo nucifera]|uniref:Uncharacterized protein n=2 Tax=Nelumbo nucifera TaxID=4432 RepID=A0A822YRX9_NELNU|nr:PREDICTED: uncharacterized protein LOC104601394 [Nelumbo nucifera]DAD35287.1 TPA_asm: hypothetical protein HUJ06_005927 [Nelumbo nucifera]